MDSEKLADIAKRMRELLGNYMCTPDYENGDDYNNEDVIELCQEYDQLVEGE